MKKLFLLTVIFCLAFTFVSRAQVGSYMDVVYLKNGSIIKGVIVENTPNVEIKIETADGSLFVYQYGDILKFAKEQAKVNGQANATEYKVARKRYPGLAFLFSTLMPGCGQYYNGQVGKGIIMNSLYVGCYAGIVYGEDDDVILACAGVALANCIWSMIDAPVSASKINRRNRQNALGMNLKNNMHIGISPDVSITQCPNTSGMSKPTPVVGFKLSLSL